MTDNSDWYDKSNRTFFELERKLLEGYPEVADIINHREGPWHLQLLCPRGHHIITVKMLRDANWHMYLSPIYQERLESGTKVADAADPSARRRSMVCPEQHCPNLDPCPVHGSDVFDNVTAPRVRLTCPWRKCGYEGMHRRERLLEMYAEAVRAECEAVRLPG